MKTLKNIMFVAFLLFLSCCNSTKNSTPTEPTPDFLLNVNLVSVDSSKYNLKKVLIKHGTFISEISKNSKLPENIIYSFLIVENQHFNTEAISHKNAIGLLQVKVGTANDIVIMAAKRGMISNFDKLNLIKLIGIERYKRLISAPCLGRNHSITEAELMKPELNLLIGCMFLNILHKETNGDLSQIGIRYLNGYFAFNSGKNITEKRLYSSKYVTKLNNIHKEISNNTVIKYSKPFKNYIS